MSYGRLRICTAHVTISVKCSQATLEIKASDPRSIGTGENVINNHMKIINYSITTVSGIPENGSCAALRQ